MSCMHRAHAQSINVLANALFAEFTIGLAGMLGQVWCLEFRLVRRHHGLMKNIMYYAKKN